MKSSLSLSSVERYQIMGSLQFAHIGAFRPCGVRLNFSIIFPDGALAELDDHRFSVDALAAFKCALVAASLIGRLNGQQQEGYPAGRAAALADRWFFGNDTTRKWHSTNPQLAPLPQENVSAATRGV